MELGLIMNIGQETSFYVYVTITDQIRIPIHTLVKNSISFAPYKAWVPTHDVVVESVSNTVRKNLDQEISDYVF
jgi:hypothetical protein